MYKTIYCIVIITLLSKQCKQQSKAKTNKKNIQKSFVKLNNESTTAAYNDTTTRCRSSYRMSSPINCSYSPEKFNCVISFRWDYDRTNDIVFFLLQANKLFDRWVAVGFSKTGLMPDSDVYLLSLDRGSQKINILDGWLNGHTGVASDRVSNIESFLASTDNDVTTASFHRSRSTNDEHDAIFSDTSCWHVILATGPLYFGTTTPLKHDTPPLVTQEKFCIDSCLVDDDESVREHVISFVTAITLQNLVYNIGLAVGSNQQTIELKNRIERSLAIAYKSLPTHFLYNIQVTVTNFLAGSVIAVYRISAQYRSNNSEIANSYLKANVTNELREYISKQGGRLPQLPYPIEVTNDAELRLSTDAPAAPSGDWIIVIAFFSAAMIIVLIIQVLSILISKQNLLDKGAGAKQTSTASTSKRPHRKNIGVDKINAALEKALQKKRRRDSNNSGGRRSSQQPKRMSLPQSLFPTAFLKMTQEAKQSKQAKRTGIPEKPAPVKTPLPKREKSSSLPDAKIKKWGSLKNNMLTLADQVKLTKLFEDKSTVKEVTKSQPFLSEYITASATAFEPVHSYKSLSESVYRYYEALPGPPTTSKNK